MKVNDQIDLMNLVDGIKGLDKTLTNIEEQAENIKKYCIASCEDYISTANYLKDLIINNNLLGRNFLGRGDFILERDNKGEWHIRTTWALSRCPSFEHDLLYDYGNQNKCTGYIDCFYLNGSGTTYSDDVIKAKNVITYIKSHKWTAEGYVGLKMKADLLKNRTEYIMKDVKDRLTDLLEQNKKTLGDIASNATVEYKNVERT